jgi:hypothetical protein
MRQERRKRQEEEDDEEKRGGEEREGIGRGEKRVDRETRRRMRRER